MLSYQRIPVLIICVATLLVGPAACGTRHAGTAPAPAASGTPGATTSTQSSPTPPAADRTGSDQARTDRAGSVWPITPQSLDAVPGNPNGPPVLTEIRTGDNGTFERLVLEFTGMYGAVSVGYVPVVRADPSDRAVSLAGAAFLRVTVHGAVARWGAPPHPYPGPSTVSPGYRTLKQATLAGDFEGVLSVGVGLGRVAGYQVSRLRGPDRLVLDVAKVPDWRMWPDDSLAQAQATQAAFEQGHQPWRGDPAQVAETYARAVYAFDRPVVTALSGNRYRLSQTGSTDTVTVTAARMFPNARPSIWEIADTR